MPWIFCHTSQSDWDFSIKSEILAKKRRQQLRQSTSARKKSPVAQTGVASLDFDDEEEDKKSSTIGEALYEDAEAAKDRLDALREDTYRREVPGYPAITRLAAEMIRDGPVSDRLYNHAKVQRRKRQEMAAGTSLHHDVDRAHDLPPNSQSHVLQPQRRRWSTGKNKPRSRCVGRRYVASRKSTRPLRGDVQRRRLSSRGRASIFGPLLFCCV